MLLFLQEFHATATAPQELSHLEKGKRNETSAFISVRTSSQSKEPKRHGVPKGGSEGDRLVGEAGKRRRLNLGE